MTDMEKVIEGLEQTVARLQYGSLDNVTLSECEDAVFDALTLLKEHDTVEHALSVLKAHGWKDGSEAVEPKPTGIEPNYNCGKCGLPIQQGYPFCPWCGKAVKWDAAD